MSSNNPQVEGVHGSDQIPVMMDLKGENQEIGHHEEVRSLFSSIIYQLIVETSFTCLFAYMVKLVSHYPDLNKPNILYSSPL